MEGEDDEATTTPGRSAGRPAAGAGGLCAPQADGLTRLPEPAPGMGRIFFYRTEATGGIWWPPNIFVDDEVVGEAAFNQFFYLDRPPGEYLVRTSLEAGDPVKVPLAAGQVQYVAFTMGQILGFMAVFTTHLRPPADGWREVQSCLPRKATP